MKKILAITSGKKTPSSRFRIRQHIHGLNRCGFIISESCPPIEKNRSVPFLSRLNPRYYLPLYFLWVLIKALQRLPLLMVSRKYDYIWLNRELVTGYYTLEGLLGKKVVLDVDDAIWKNPPFGHYAAKRIAKESYAVICGNEYLANWFRKYNDRVYIIPTAVDTERFHPVSRDTKASSIMIGWIGTHGNLKYIEEIFPSILSLLNEYKSLKLNIVCDKQPSFIGMHSSVTFTKWSEEDEIQNFQSIDIGLMPLPDNEWTKGKCSFKLLQHLSCGSLVVGSPVGMNKSVLLGAANGAYSAKTKNEWYFVLKELIDDFDEIYPMQKEKARDFIIDNYSAVKIQSELKKVFSNG
ncbi:glycosyltransferase family 4 protein [Erwinia aphidicola]|uniref:glycosyltransferase family 4 protein n=1 Tax=Erwinia aphidicola TaxID=68334 RepID=UPI003CEE5736